MTGAVVAGVTVMLGGAEAATRTTDASGGYTFDDLANGTYTVTPSLAGNAFNPMIVVVTTNGTDVVVQDFVATVQNAVTGAIIHWDGRAWGFVAGIDGLEGVSGSSAADAWAVGVGGAIWVTLRG